MIPGTFTGGWLGVDMFLTLSGFFIAAMLIQEHRSTGSIHYWNFIKRRGRRLLPGQLFLFCGVLIMSYFLVPVGRQDSVARDTIASLLEVVNWRFISNEQSYFNNLGMPSPLRHMWSLNVQEQYYVLFPLLLILINVFVKSRNGKVVIFMGLAAVSMWRMHELYVPGTDPSRVYFGTDTRIFEVLIGVLAAFMLSERAFATSKGHEHYGWLTRWDRVLGWAGLASVLLLFRWMLTVSEYSPWLFPKGLAAVCGLTLVAIIAASSPYENLLQRILSWRVLRWIGRMGLPLYLWHWPLAVFTRLAMPEWPLLVQNVVSMGLTVALGYWTHQHLEEPIHRHGIKALFPSRPFLRKVVVFGSVPAIVVGSFALANSASLANTGDSVELDTPWYTATDTRMPVMLLGNSVAVGLSARGQTNRFPDLPTGHLASLGCDPFVRQEVDKNKKSIPPSKECLAWKQRWPTRIDPNAHATFVYIISPNLFPNYLVDGKTVKPGQPAHDHVITGILDELRQTVFDRGAGAFMVANLACRERFDFGEDIVVTRSNDFEMVKHLNSVVGTWADKHHVTVIDQYGALCPGDRFFEDVNGVLLYDDTVHFSEASAPIIWSWMAPQIQKVARERGTEADGLADLRQ
jgi:peptidoglycan/LPS O-acetylase OafA/YrhL